MCIGCSIEEVINVPGKFIL